MDLEELLANPPRLHSWLPENVPSPPMLAPEILRFIHDHTTDRSRTLETGAGISTIVFAMKGSRHTCITPDGDGVQRITDFCKENRIDASWINFVVERSENALPALKPHELDLVLIDGCHGFPVPFLDWFYTCSRLRPQRFLIIDDTQLWTGQVLKQFLRLEPEWKQVEPFSKKTAVFLKLADYSPGKEWNRQTYVVCKSNRRARFRNGVRLLVQGKLLSLIRKLVRHVRRRPIGPDGIER
jgi:hypothetical protein